jgi:glycosyltransferase involved in cell wall biosynthesis
MPEMPSVTIGIPTYNRPDRLERALACVSRQRYPSLTVVVSDNASPGNAVEAIVDRYRDRIVDLVFIKQQHNIGVLPNYYSLLANARSKYFMWLADDDEISDDYVAALIQLLEADPEVVSASGTWYWLRTEAGGQVMPSVDLSGGRALHRATRFIWQGDDAFFYALHRTEMLRRASFPGFAWPNRANVLNWGYVYLFDLVLRGKIVQHPDAAVRFINHDYTTKAYAVRDGRVRAALKGVLRRINVHWLYVRKAAAVLGVPSACLIAAVCVARMAREAVANVRARVTGHWRALSARRI